MITIVELHPPQRPARNPRTPAQCIDRYLALHTKTATRPVLPVCVHIYGWLDDRVRLKSERPLATMAAYPASPGSPQSQPGIQSFMDYGLSPGRPMLPFRHNRSKPSTRYCSRLCGKQEHGFPLQRKSPLLCQSRLEYADRGKLPRNGL